MTTIHSEIPPTHMEVGADIVEVTSEVEFYFMMLKDPTWEHGLTFMADVLVDTSDVPQWKVEEHDITYTTVGRYKVQRTWYVLALRNDTWK